MKKSFICLVLTAFMAVSSLPKTAFAETVESNAETAAERDEKIDELIEIMGKVIK